MEIRCSRCGQTVAQMETAPLPTATGREIYRQVCQACWQDWLRTQVMLINEYRLNLMSPEVRTRLEGEMRRFLKLSETAE